MLKSEELLPSSFMLQDCDDVQEAGFSEESLRQESLKQLSDKYCKDVLLVLFDCYESRKDYATCISFMARVRARQPMV